MTERTGWPERLLTGGPLLVLAAFLCYNVAIRLVVIDSLSDGIVQADTAEMALAAVAALPLLWVGGRTLLGWSDLHSRLLASAWAVVAVFVGPFFWETSGVRLSYQHLLIPSHEQTALVGSVLIAVGSLTTLVYLRWDGWRSPDGVATRTNDVPTTTPETPLLGRRMFLGGGFFALSWTTAALLLSRGVSNDPLRVPSATFDFEQLPSGRVRIIHTGGSSFTRLTTDALTVRYTDGSGVTQQEVWADTTNGGLPVQAGDTYTTSKPVKPGTTLRVIWTKAGGAKTQTVGSFEVDG